MESIWHYRSRSSDLVGTVIDVHNGDWIRRGMVGFASSSMWKCAFLLKAKQILIIFSRVQKKSNLLPVVTSLRLAFLLVQPRYEVFRVVFDLKSPHLHTSEFSSSEIVLINCSTVLKNWRKFNRPYSGSQPWSRDFFWIPIFSEIIAFFAVYTRVVF